MTARPSSEACEENKQPILRVIQPLLQEAETLLEIGSGTGQHAIHFAAAMPDLIWQTSDCLENLPGIRAWLEYARLGNLPDPILLDVSGSWPETQFDAVFSANTTHIMSWPEVERLFEGIQRVLKPGGLFLLYGPFNYAGQYTSESNRRFDQWLHARDPRSGIRDFQALNGLAERQGLGFTEDIEMPVNNRILVWHRLQE